MELAARPGRKPQPPQATQTASQPAAPNSETGPSGADAQPATQTAGRAQPPSDGAPAGDQDATQTTSAPDDAPASADETAENAPTQTATAAQPAEGTDTNASETGDQAGGDQAAGPPDTGGTAGAGDAGSGDDGAQTGEAGQTQTASLPPGGLPEQMRLRFDNGSATLTDEVKRRLDQLSQLLEDNPRQRVQLMAYAEGSEDTASQARRLSLSRALVVRTYLIDHGIRSTRMDVRALGATADQGPLDRVDIVPARR